MSRECTQAPHPGAKHDHMVDRLKKRLGGLKQHSDLSLARYAALQAVRTDKERKDTAKLRPKVQEDKLKKTGKFKTDPLRSKQLLDPSFEIRNDFTEAGLSNLKRKREMNGMPGTGTDMYNDRNSSAPSSGMNGFGSPGVFDFDNGANHAKRIKLDNSVPLTTTTANGSGFTTDSQISVQNQSSAASLNLQITNSMTTPTQENISPPVHEVLSDSDLESILNGIERDSGCGIPEKPLKEIENNLQGKESSDVQLSSHSHNEVIKKPAYNSDVLGNLLPSPVNQGQHISNNSNQLQPEAIYKPQTPTVNSNMPQPSPYSLPASQLNSPVGTGQLLPNHGGNFTSPHMQNLNTGVEASFGSPINEHDKLQPIRHIRTPNSVEKLCPTPEEANGHMHPPGYNLSHAMSPSPGSVRLTHIPSPQNLGNYTNNALASGGNSGALYGPRSPRGQLTHAAQADSSNLKLQQAQRKQLPVTMMQLGQPAQLQNQQYTNAPRTNYLPQKVASSNFSTEEPNLAYQAQRLNQFPDKRTLAVDAQWNAKKGRMPLDINRNSQPFQQACLAQQTSVSNHTVSNQSFSSSVRPENLYAAKAAAQNVLMDAKQRQQASNYAARLPEYRSEVNSMNYQRATNMKGTPPNFGMTSLSHMQQGQVHTSMTGGLNQTHSTVIQSDIQLRNGMPVHGMNGFHQLPGNTSNRTPGYPSNPIQTSHNSSMPTIHSMVQGQGMEKRLQMIKQSAVQQRLSPSSELLAKIQSPQSVQYRNQPHMLSSTNPGNPLKQSMVIQESQATAVQGNTMNAGLPNISYSSSSNTWSNWNAHSSQIEERELNSCATSFNSVPQPAYSGSTDPRTMPMNPGVRNLGLIPRDSRAMPHSNVRRVPPLQTLGNATGGQLQNMYGQSQRYVSSADGLANNMPQQRQVQMRQEYGGPTRPMVGVQPIVEPNRSFF